MELGSYLSSELSSELSSKGVDSSLVFTIYLKYIISSSLKNICKGLIGENVLK